MQQHEWLENVRQVKEARLKRQHTAWFHLHNILEKEKLQERNQVNCCKGLEAGRGEWLQRGKGEVFGVKEIVYTSIVGVVMQLYNFAKIYRTIHLKRVNITSYGIYSNEPERKERLLGGPEKPRRPWKCPNHSAHWAQPASVRGQPGKQKIPQVFKQRQSTHRPNSTSTWGLGCVPVP